MLAWIMIIIFFLGFNFIFWFLIGLLRFITKKGEYLTDFCARMSAGFARTIMKIKNITVKKPIFPDFLIKNIGEHTKNDDASARMTIMPEEVAAIIPAHNEEATIAKTIESLTRIMPPGNIFIGNDASTDKTGEIARRFHCHVLDIYPNIGKANILARLIETFRLTEYFRAVMIVDADSEVDAHYLKNALPLLGAPGIAAVAVHAESKWYDHFWPRGSMLFAAYRVRMYRIIQAMIRYGQTWKYTNVSMIIPGYASIYRSSALENIKINAPNLVIEDYNMTFEVHHKKLGKIAYSPSVRSASQDPVNFRDYIRQVKRWNLGMWQTIRRHGIWPAFFWVSTGAFISEIFFYSIYWVIFPFLLLWSALGRFAVPFIPPGLNIFYLLNFFLGIMLADYILTVIVAIYEKKPVLLLYGPAFFILRYIDAFMFVYTLPLAFFTHSDGRWTSPKRQTA